MSEHRRTFRSWAEDYQPAADEQPIDREAFRARALQRAQTRRHLEGQTRSFFGMMTMGQRCKIAYDRTVAANVAAEYRDREMRRTSPVQQAKLHLQRRGTIVFRASVTGGHRDLWSVPGHGELSDEQLLKLAESKGWRRAEG